MSSIRSFVHAACIVSIMSAASFALVAQTPETAAPAKPAHSSNGLTFAINSIHIAHGTLFIQYAVQNTTNVRQYIILYGSGSASTDSGQIGQVQVSQTSGIAHCWMQKNYDEDNLNSCREGTHQDGGNGGGANIDNYTYIEPGDVAEASIVYDFGSDSVLRQAKTASFKFLALVRTGTATQDALSDPSKSVSKAKVVNINFPFVPLHNGD